MVEAQHAGHRSEVGVVDRAARRLRGAAKFGERDVEGLEAAREAAAPQQRRRRSRRPADHALERFRERANFENCVGRLARETRERAARNAESLAEPARKIAWQAAQRAPCEPLRC